MSGVVRKEETCGLKIVFLDSLLFLDAGLDTLTKGLTKPGDDVGTLRGKLPIMSKAYESNDEFLRMVRGKTAYCYSYFDKPSRFEETEFPPHSAFRSELSDTNISQELYEETKRTYHETCSNLGEWSDKYCMHDVYCLASVFEGFRTMMHKECQLEALACVTAGQLFWAAMLKKTKVRLELLTDKDQYEFCEGAVGGIVQTYGYARTNHPGYPDYRREEPVCTIQYQDATSLYQSGGMIRSLPQSGFHWVSGEAAKARFETVQRDLGVSGLSDDGFFDGQPGGMFIECDLDIVCTSCWEKGERSNGSVCRNCPGCRALEDKLDNYPLGPVVREVRLSEMSKATLENRTRAQVDTTTPKVVLDHSKKKRYVIHEKLLVLYERLGLRPVKFHRGLKFTQSRWLKPWIDWASEKRKLAATDFEKALYKLAGNCIWGKTYENVRTRSRIVLIHSGDANAKKRLSKLFANTGYSGAARFGEVLAVHLQKSSVTLNKTPYVGMACLHLSKHQMTSWWYEIKSDFGACARLLKSDTDSVLWGLTHKEPWAYLNWIKERRDTFDTSNYPKDHALYSEHNKKVLGTFKEECPPEHSEGAILAVMGGNGCDRGYAIALLNKMPSKVLEFVGLAPKSDALRFLGDGVAITGKGVPNAVRRKLLFSEYKETLLGGSPIYRQASAIRAQGHDIVVKTQNKKVLSAFTDKRWLIGDDASFESLPYGHYDIVNGGSRKLLMEAIRVRETNRYRPTSPVELLAL